MKYKYKLQIYNDTKNEFRWSLIAKNGRIIANSGEGYRRYKTMFKTINNLFGDKLSSGEIIVI